MMRRVAPVAALLVLALAVSVTAAPIRVGILKGSTSDNRARGRNDHRSIHTAASAIASILARPDSANLGPNLIIPAVGFETIIFGTGTAGQDSTARGTPTPAQFATFFNALDSLDVLWLPNFAVIGSSVTDSTQRKLLENFIRTKGFVSSHNTIYSEGNWPAWDSIHGATARIWSADRRATLHLDTASKRDPDQKFLNRGLPDTARIFEEWISFDVKGDEIRAKAGLKVTVNMDEASYEGGLNSAYAMGDHPISWFRRFPEGGRFFYTALGHHARNYNGAAVVDSTGDTTSLAVTFLRRQLYNAILWAAGVDSNGVVSVRSHASRKSSNFSDAARVSARGGILSVSILQDGPHVIEIAGVEGRRVAVRRGAARGDYGFPDLRPGTVYVVRVAAGGQRTARLVTTP